MRWTGGVQCTSSPLCVSRHASRLHSIALHGWPPTAQSVVVQRGKKRENEAWVHCWGHMQWERCHCPYADSSFCWGQRNEGLSLRQVSIQDLKWYCLEPGEHCRLCSCPCTAFDEMENMQMVPAYRPKAALSVTQRATPLSGSFSH